MENLDGAVLFMGKPVEYWRGLQILAEKNNLDESMIFEYYLVKGELEHLKLAIKRLHGSLNG